MLHDKFVIIDNKVYLRHVFQYFSSSSSNSSSSSSNDDDDGGSSLVVGMCGIISVWFLFGS